MDKANFEKITRDLEVRISVCEKRLGSLNTKDKLLSISLKEYVGLKSFCQEEQGRMDKINVDLYHLVGMGNLTPIQLQKFCSLVKKYLTYRSDIKYLACLNTIDLNIDFPHSSDYKTYLGQIKLIAEPRTKK